MSTRQRFPTCWITPVLGGGRARGAEGRQGRERSSVDASAGHHAMRNRAMGFCY